MDYCLTCQRHLNGALHCQGCGAPASRDGWGGTADAGGFAGEHPPAAWGTTPPAAAPAPGPSDGYGGYPAGYAEDTGHAPGTAPAGYPGYAQDQAQDHGHTPGYAAEDPPYWGAQYPRAGDHDAHAHQGYPAPDEYERIPSPDPFPLADGLSSDHLSSDGLSSHGLSSDHLSSDGLPPDHLSADDALAEGPPSRRADSGGRRSRGRGRDQTGTSRRARPQGRSRKIALVAGMGFVLAGVAVVVLPDALGPTVGGSGTANSPPADSADDAPPDTPPTGSRSEADQPTATPSSAEPSASASDSSSPSPSASPSTSASRPSGLSNSSTVTAPPKPGGGGGAGPTPTATESTSRPDPSPSDSDPGSCFLFWCTD